MANELITASMITAETMMQLKNHTIGLRNVTRKYEKEFARDNLKIGATLKVRKPVQYELRTGSQAVPQNTVEEYVEVTIDKQAGVDLQFHSDELATKISKFSSRYIERAVEKIADYVDQEIMALYKGVWNQVGTANTVPSTSLTYLQAGQFLSDGGTPTSDRRLMINPEMNATIVNALQGLFQSDSEISKQYVKGQMRNALGFKWFETQNVRRHTHGTFTSGSTPTINGTQTGASILTAAWQASTDIFKKGDLITLGINAINQMSKENLGRLQRFVVTEDVTSAGSGAATIPISPSIIIAGPRQTVSGAAISGTAVTRIGTEDTIDAIGLAVHPEWATAVFVDLPMPKGMDMAHTRSDPDSGLSVRFVRGYDIIQDRFVSRLDVLFGCAVMRPEMACRIYSA